MRNEQLTHERIATMREEAKRFADQDLNAKAFEALQPLIDHIAQAVAIQSCSTLEEIDWYNMDLGPLLKAWREAIIEWESEGFTGMHPGQRALGDFLTKYLEEVHQHTPYPERDPFEGDHVFYRGIPAIEFVQHIEDQVWGIDSEFAGELVDSIREDVCRMWFHEALTRSVPSGVHAEFRWVPNWDGRSLDDMSHLQLRTKQWNCTYMDDLLPCDALKHFLTWVNLSTSELIDATRARSAPEGDRLKANLDGFSVERDATRPSLISAEDAITIFENIGSSQAVATVHAYVDVRALLTLDPRLPIALPLKGECMHIGWHDTLNGAGYMDTFPGTAVIPPMSLGFAWEGRGSYGINKTYCLYLPPFYCVPENIVPAVDEGAEDQRKSD